MADFEYIESPLLALPREIRDTIYSHLLSSQQKIHLPLSVDDNDIIRYTSEHDSYDLFKHEITHPRLMRPEENISVTADASFFPKISKPNNAGRTSVRDTGEQVAHQSILSRWHALHKITAKKDSVNGVAILRTCKQVYEEAKPMLYPHCTFVFPVNAPLKIHELKITQTLFKQMQHVELHLDLPVAYLRHYSTLAEGYTACAWYELLRLISGTMTTEGNAKSCTLLIDYRETLKFVSLCFAHLPALLKPFDVVTINLRSVYQNPRFRISDESFATTADKDEFQINDASVQIVINREMARMVSDLENGVEFSAFGTGLGHVVSKPFAEGGRSLVFHPK